MTPEQLAVLNAHALEVMSAIAEGGQYYQIGDMQFRRAELLAAWQVAKESSVVNQANAGFGVASVRRLGD